MRDGIGQEVLSWNRSPHHWDITHHWDILLTRSPNDWEEDRILNLLSLLTDLDVDVHPEGEDKIVWSIDSRGIFSVKCRC